MKFIVNLYRFAAVFQKIRPESKSARSKIIYFNTKLEVTEYWGHSSEGVLWKRCSWKFCNIYRKTLLLESLFNKLQAWRPVFLLKRASNTSDFLPTSISFFIEYLWQLLHSGEVFFMSFFYTNKLKLVILLLLFSPEVIVYPRRSIWIKRVQTSNRFLCKYLASIF